MFKGFLVLSFEKSKGNRLKSDRRGMFLRWAPSRALENVFGNGCLRVVGSGYLEVWKFAHSQTLVLPLVGGMVSTATDMASGSDLSGVGTKLDQRNIGESLWQPALLGCARKADSNAQNRIPGKFWSEI